MQKLSSEIEGYRNKKKSFLKMENSAVYSSYDFQKNK